MISLGDRVAAELRRMIQRGEDGVLSVVSGECFSRSLAFVGDKACPVFQPAIDNEAFGEVLVFMGVMDRRTLREVLASPEGEAGHPIARILERRKILSREGILDALKGYLRQQVLELFVLDHGEAVFEPKKIEGEGLVPYDSGLWFDARDILTDGDDHKREWAWTLEGLPGPAEILRLHLGARDSTVIPHAPESLTLLLDGTRSFGEILERARFPRQRTVAILRQMWDEGLLVSLEPAELLKSADRFEADPLGREIRFLALYHEKVPGDEAAHQRLAEALARSDRDVEASRAYLLLARQAGESGNDEKALEFYQHAADLDPGAVEARERLLDFARAQGDQKRLAENAVGLLEAHLARGPSEDARVSADRVGQLPIAGPFVSRVRRTIGRVRHQTGDASAARVAYREAEEALGPDPDPGVVFDLYQDMVEWPDPPADALAKVEALGGDLPDVPLEAVSPPARTPPAVPRAETDLRPADPQSPKGSSPRVRPRPKRRLGKWLAIAGAGVALVGSFAVWLVRAEGDHAAKIEEAQSALVRAGSVESQARSKKDVARLRDAIRKYHGALALFKDAGAIVCLSSLSEPAEAQAIPGKIQAIGAEIAKIEKDEKARREAPYREVESLLAAGKVDEAGIRLAAIDGAPEFEARRIALAARIEEARAGAAKSQILSELAARLAGLRDETAEADLAWLEENRARIDADLEAARRASSLRIKAIDALVARSLPPAEAAIAKADARLSLGRPGEAAGPAREARLALDGFPRALATGEILAKLQTAEKELLVIETALTRYREDAASLAREAEILHGNGEYARAREIQLKILDDEIYRWTETATALKFPFEVSTDPPGATVLVDGRPADRVTPCQIVLARPAETISVVIEKRGFHRVERKLATRDAPILALSLVRAHRWSAELEGKVADAEPAITADRVYVGSRDAFLYAFDHDGRVLWKFRESRVAEIGARPLPLAGRVAFGTINTGDFYVLNDRGTSCERERKFSLGGSVVGDPVDDSTRRRVFVPVEPGRIVALDMTADSGAPLWEVNLLEILGRPAASEDALFVASRSERGNQLARLDPATGRAAWQVALESTPTPGPVLAGDRLYLALLDGRIEVRSAATGESIEKFPLPAETKTRPWVTADRLHAVTVGGIWKAFDLATRRELWSLDTRIANPYHPTALAGRGYLAGEDGRIAAIDLATGSILWTLDMRARIEAPPAAGHGLIVVAAGKTVYAFEDLGD